MTDHGGWSIAPDETDLGWLADVDTDADPIDRADYVLGVDPDTGTWKRSPSAAVVLAEEPPDLPFGEFVGTVFVSIDCRFFDRNGQELQ